MTKGEQARLTAWRLRVLQQAAQDQNVARICRRFGISPKTFYKWKRRHTEHGDAGLADRPRTPRRSPRATPRDVVSKILYLRQHYHFGPGRIAAYLRRFHRLEIAGSSVHRILKRQGLNRLPANQKHRPHGKRWQRCEKPQPGHRLQIDVKFLERIPGTQRRLYQFTAIDDCTRIRVLKIYDACNQRTAIQFFDKSAAPVAVSCARGADRQRRGVPVPLPLASGGAGRPPCLHSTSHAASQRQSRALAPRR